MTTLTETEKQTAEKLGFDVATHSIQATMSMLDDSASRLAEKNYVGRIAGVVGALVGCAHGVVTNGLQASNIAGGVVGIIVGYNVGKCADMVTGVTGSQSPLMDVGACAAGFATASGVAKATEGFDSLINKTFFKEDDATE